VKLGRGDLSDAIILALMSSTPVAFMSFDFMFPNLSTPSLDKNFMAMFLISILIGMPSGYFSRRTDMAMLTVIIYVAIGYVWANVMYSAPYLLYDMGSVLPYYGLFLRFTVILLFIFIVGGFMGTVLGQLIRDSVRREETSLTFPKKADK
jgi:hypothetical protein